MTDRDDGAYAEVVLPRRLDRVFDYAVPEALAGHVRRGTRVLVRFGAQTLTGYVVRLMAQTVVPNPRPILAVLDREPAVDDALLDLTHWLADTYAAPWGLCLKAAMLPMAHTAPDRPGMATTTIRRVVRITGTPDAIANVRNPRQRALLALLMGRRQRTAPRDVLATKMKRTVKGLAGLIRTLKAKGLVDDETVIITPKKRQRSRPPDGQSAPPRPLSPPASSGEPAVSAPAADHETPVEPPRIAPETETVVADLRRAIESRRFFPCLLEGRRNERLAVYLEAAGIARREGRKSLLLFPEVAAIEPVMRQVRALAGDRVAVLHSGLTPTTRQAEWDRIRAGRADIVLGTRSAVFAPLTAIGLIVVDEAQDHAYKAEEGPRYLAPDVARKRAETDGAVLLLGAIVPSVEAVHDTAIGRVTRLAQPDTRHPRPGPRVEIVDLGPSHMGGRETLLTGALRTAIAERIARGERVVLLLNRRGYSSALLCRDCGQVLRCPHCSTAVALHRPEADSLVGGPLLRCHTCGAQVEPPQACPACHGTRLTGLGQGTELVEEELRQAFPAAAILRLDRDVPDLSRRRTTLTLSGAEILIGTQLLIHRLLATPPAQAPHTTLVAVLLADVGLHLPDFRAGERTFHLLAQLMELLGPEGTLLVQTYHPHHPAIAAHATAGEAGVSAFYEHELRDRRLLGYPPFVRLARVILTGPPGPSRSGGPKRPSATTGRLREVAERIATRLRADPGITVLGPSPALVRRLRGRERWHLVVKALPDDPRTLGMRLRPLVEEAERQGITVSLDLDPVEFT